jgi:hypothetical protein
MTKHFPSFDTWPYWVQLLVFGPHALLAAYAMWFWWPKSNREWRRFGFVALYLIAFYLVMRFVFQMR